MDHAKLEIDGMHCGHCVAAVSQALGRLDGVQVEQVKIGSATVRYDPAKTSVDALIDAVNDEGYTASRAA
jgi:copper chaperone CopZ